MQSLRPILSVAEVEQAAQFYCDKLGFDLRFSLQDKNDKTFFASVGLGDCAILLNLQQPLEISDEIRHQIRADASIMIVLPADRDIDSFYADVQATGVTIREEIADKFWGNREFGIRDPNGYCVSFAASNRDVSLDEAKDAAASLDIDPSDSTS